ncbi:hypothetical protein [Hyphococcus luteus]|uniref:hypothetical protein n=1 Tax=Hyphococcus luteus TaxID=2058213 RepID=UPI0013FE3FEC|nr:hypothetical protein [Marinicaulis flavus]
MKHALLTAAVTLMATPAFAGSNYAVPEMDAGAGVAAIALLVGIGAILREKMKK